MNLMKTVVSLIEFFFVQMCMLHASHKHKAHSYMLHVSQYIQMIVGFCDKIAKNRKKNKTKRKKYIKQ